MKNQGGRLTRGLLVVGALALATVVLLASWGSYRTVRDAARLLLEAEAEALWREATTALFEERREPPSSSDLEAVLARYSPAGLRFLALLGPGGEVLTSAGSTAAPLPDPARNRRPGLEIRHLTARSPEGQPEGPRLRVIGTVGEPPPPAAGGRPPAPPPRGADGRPPAAPPRAGARRPPPPPRRPPPRPRPGADRPPAPSPLVVLELEPQISPDLQRTTRQALATGLAAALALAMGAAAFRQLLHQREAAQREMAERRRLAALGEMAAVLAHEIRNPLASVKGNAQLLAEGLAGAAGAAGIPGAANPPNATDAGGGDRLRRQAERLVTDVKRLQLLSEDLLELGRQGPIERRPVDPAALAREAAEVAQGLDPGVAVEVEAAGAPARWPADPGRLLRALGNLVTNAVQASPAGQAVRLRVAREGGELLFEVLDRGPGLPAEIRNRLFEPFVTTRARGTGLGLAVARRIVEMHGGRILAADRPGGGTRMSVHLPPRGA